MTVASVGLTNPHTPADIDRAPNREAERITGRPYVSHSQLSTMRQCPRKFAYLYVEKAPRDFQASSLLFGSAAHSAFESHFRSRLEGLVTSGGDLLHAFLQKWSHESQALGEDIPIRFNKGEDMNTITDLAQRMIDAFLASPLSKPHGQIVGIEESFKVVIDEGLPDVLAKVDLVTQTDHALHVVDLKTSRSRWSEERAAEGSEQLLLYGRTVGAMARGVGLPVKLHFAVITKAKKPVVQVIDVPADESRLATVHHNVAEVWQAVKAGNYFANPSPLNCSICPFKTRCPAFTGK